MIFIVLCHRYTFPLRTTHFYSPTDLSKFKNQLLKWSQQFDDVVWLDSNDHHNAHHNYDAILAVDAFTSIKTGVGQGFESLQSYQSSAKDWIFGYLTYDLKNELEDLKSKGSDGLGFPDLYFFQPKRLFLFKDHRVEVQYLKMVDDELESDLKTIEDFEYDTEPSTSEPLAIKARISKALYFEKLNEFLAHIQRGDIYEANFCQEFYAENATIHPLETYQKLNAISKAPFATFFKSDEHYVLSASPERYIKKTGNYVVTQPIKGTAKRSSDPEIDLQLQTQLQNCPKERSENIMIVDLVRNDLAHTAQRGTVVVEELCAIYSFEQVHQLISTISSKVDDAIDPVSILKTTFPMGSMTGAPKISAMKIIEAIETTKRGLYSGTVGYFAPNGDFDFNVIIRSILYNAKNAYVSFSVGGAITAKSIPEEEYAECLIKAQAMRKVLEG